MSSTEIGMTVIEEESIEIASTPDSEISEKIKSGSPRQKNQDTGEDQDTDLELEEEKEEFDVTGRNQYLSVCRTLGVVPSSYFLRHMQDSTLSLRHHGIGSLGGKAISYPLMNNTTVVKLDLQDNWLEGEGGESIARMLKENCYITDLDISENRLSSKGAKALCNMLTSNTTLKRINLSGNLFSDRDAGYFFEAFSENSRLKYVNLSHNEFSDNAAVVLGQAIAENETIEELDLSWNFFRRGSTLKLCEGIWSNCRLKEINLSMNGFGDEGALAVAEILKRSITLYVMDISYNRISKTGATAIGKALDQNDALRTLRIGHNPFGVEGAKDILKGVGCEHCVITQLDLSGIEVDKEFRELKQVLEETKELQVTHGVVLSDYVIKVKPKKAKEQMFGVYIADITPSNILQVIKQYSHEKDIKLGDMFISLDRKKMGSVTIQEFIQGLQSCGLEIQESQMSTLVDLLDAIAPENLINYSIFKSK
ncbi:leucine-rich repeat-containing protein 74A-like [Saccostrea echinata]|uniref:leucine-rich repeat-containing protein 74A-like n=1 Tax=Saccostrea echinata TaxID=191078 RepID=UPI002A81A760|nr:leucine-rich repeat-containing protein 74A-like [Saccostrea echinata]